MEMKNLLTENLTAEKTRELSLRTRMSQKQEIFNDILLSISKEAIEGKYNCFRACYRTIYPEVLDSIIKDLESLGYIVTTCSLEGGIGIKIKWAE